MGKAHLAVGLFVCARSAFAWRLVLGAAAGAAAGHASVTASVTNHDGAAGAAAGGVAHVHVFAHGFGDVDLSGDAAVFHFRWGVVVVGGGVGVWSEAAGGGAG